MGEQPGATAVLEPRRGPRLQLRTRLAPIVRALRQMPFTASWAALTLLLGLLSGSLLHGPRGALVQWVGASVPNLSGGHLVMLLTSGLWASNLSNYLLGTVVLVTAGLVVERRHGTARTAAMGLAAQLLGVLAGLLFVHAVNPLAESWSNALRASTAVTPLILGVGLLMAGTATMSALWRRRVRLLGFSVLIALALYGGYLEDSLTLSGAVVGVIAGTLFWRPTGPRPLLNSTRRETRALVGVIVAISAAGPLLVSSSPTAVGPLRVLRYLFTAPGLTGPALRAVCVNPDQAQLCVQLIAQNRFHGLGSSVHAILPALVVFVLAWGLYRGRRSAWWMAIATHLLLLTFGITLAVTTALHRPGRFGGLVRMDLSGAAGQILPIVAPLLILVLLVGTRTAFRVRAPVGTYLRLIGLLVVTLAALFVAYLLIGHAFRAELTPRPDWGDLAASFPLRLIPPGYLGLGVPRLMPHTTAATLLVEWTGVLAWLVALGGILVSFRRTQTSARLGDLARARRILRGTGGSALSYLTTWEDNTYWFDAAGTSFIAYRAHGGVALTTTDPVGPVAERAAVIEEFSRFCDGNGWVPCLYSVTAQTRDAADRLGWSDVQVAEETVLQLGALEFKGKKFQDIRTAVNRAGKSGIEARWISYPSAPLAITEQVLGISEEWVADKALPEMGFTLGGVDELNDPEVRCLVAMDAGGKLHGITSWLPVYRDDTVIGWTLDFMRRPGDSFPGVMEFLIGTAALAFQEQGAEFVSLSGAPLARVGEDDDDSALQRLLDVMGRALEPVYGFRSLLAFKAKFQPVYRPLYMSFPDSAALPRIAAAIGHAYVPHLSLGQLVRTVGKL